MEITTILYIIIGVVTFDYIFESVLGFLNVNNQPNEIPEKYSSLMEKEKYSKSVAYSKESHQFSFLSSTISTSITIMVLAFGVFGAFDTYLANYIETPLLLSLAFFGAIFIISDILNIPLQLYNQFKIEEKYGFNKMTYKLFFTDKIKGYVITAIVGGALISLLIWLIQFLGENFWIIFWVVVSIFMLLVNMFYTSLILPLFNKLSPLKDEELNKKITDYCKSVDFPLVNIYEMDGSKRSSKANAFFSGIGKNKKVVLFDTLINDLSHGELIAVLAHEIGHYKKRHIISNYILGIAQTGLILFILSQFVNNEYLSYSLGGASNAIHLNLIAFGILFSPLSRIIGIGMNVFSRKNEFEADAYAKNTFNGLDLANALKKLSTNNLSNLFPHPAYVFMHYSHPPVIRRLQELE